MFYGCPWRLIRYWVVGMIISQIRTLRPPELNKLMYQRLLYQPKISFSFWDHFLTRINFRMIISLRWHFHRLICQFSFIFFNFMHFHSSRWHKVHYIKENCCLNNFLALNDTMTFGTTVFSIFLIGFDRWYKICTHIPQPIFTNLRHPYILPTKFLKTFLRNVDLYTHSPTKFHKFKISLLPIKRGFCERYLLSEVRDGMESLSVHPKHQYVYKYGMKQHLDVKLARIV